MKAVFVTGTDTDVGKTVASAWLCKHWQADYWKPIQSGLDGPSDSDKIKLLSGARIHPETHRLTQPLSPHQAADIDGVQIRLSDFQLPTGPEKLVVEGAGGCLVPLNWREQTTDLIAALDLCCLLVARSGLGTINHTCLSIQALRNAHIPILGVLMTGPQNDPNREAIEHFGQVPVLACLPHFDTLNAEALNQFKPTDRLMNALDSL